MKRFLAFEPTTAYCRKILKRLRKVMHITIFPEPHLAEIECISKVYLSYMYTVLETVKLEVGVLVICM